MNNIKTWMKAILAEPDDDSHRLVFADWLNDQGHSDRAEFIRVQCALARMAGDDPQRPELTQREEVLLDQHEKEWKKEVAAWAGKHAWFRRGFVDHVSTGFKTFIGKGGALLGKAPVASVYLLEANGANLKSLAACPHLASLHDIQFRDCEIEKIGLLLDSPHAAGLRGLHFYVLAGFAARFPALAPLLQSPKLATLSRLSIRHVGFDETDIRRFVQIDAVRNLEKLRLENMETTDAAVRELANGDFTNLRELGIDGSQILTDEGVRALAESPWLRQVGTLNLRCSRRVTDDGMQALAKSSYLKNLTDLDLTSTGVSEVGVGALIESANLPRLSRIDLLIDSGLKRLFRKQRWKPAPDADCVTLWVQDCRK